MKDHGKRTAEPLIAAFAKIGRAKAQINDVANRIELWARSSPYSVVHQINPYDAQEEVWSFVPNPIGFDLAVIVGETLHNIRSPLDQALAAVAEITGSSDGVAFTFGKTEAILEKAIARQRRLLPADAIEMIRSLKPYRGGNDLLWSINELSRGDKHRPQLLPVGAVPATRLSSIECQNGMLLILGDRRGSYMTTVKSGGGSPYVPCSKRHPYADGEIEFVTCTPGTRFRTDVSPLCQIAFGKIEALSSEPIVTVLHKMRDQSEAILRSFEAKFFT